MDGDTLCFPNGHLAQSFFLHIFFLGQICNALPLQVVLYADSPTVFSNKSGGSLLPSSVFFFFFALKSVRVSLCVPQLIHSSVRLRADHPRRHQRIHTVKNLTPEIVP